MASADSIIENIFEAEVDPDRLSIFSIFVVIVKFCFSIVEFIYFQPPTNARPSICGRGRQKDIPTKKRIFRRDLVSAPLVCAFEAGY